MAAPITLAAGHSAPAATAHPGPPGLPVTSAVLAQEAAAVTPNIVGGYGVTTPKSWMVSLQYDAPAYGITDYHTCGGTLLFRQWVVTNAHCVTDPPASEQSTQARTALAQRYDTSLTALSIPTADKQFHVRVGSLDRTSGGETATVTQIIASPGWNWGQTTPFDDIALLKLDHPLAEQPIQLASSTARPGAHVTLYGWGEDDPAADGTTTPGEPQLPTMLQGLAVTVAPTAECTDQQISTGELCLSNPNGTDGPCYGDSGGPAVETVNGIDELVGGASRIEFQWCGTGKAVYTSTPDFRTWLYDTVRGVPASAESSTAPATSHR